MAGQEPPIDSRKAFERSLEGLTFNCKPRIDDLTRAAGQFEAEESHIIGVIETRIMKVAEESQVNGLSFSFIYYYVFHIAQNCLTMIMNTKKFIITDHHEEHQQL